MSIALSGKLVFLCGTRDYHAMDWYRSAQQLFPRRKILLLTDLIGGEGFKKLIEDGDQVYNLVIIDRFLFNTQSRMGNIWRNIVKLVVFPLQVFLLNKFSKKNVGAIYHAHSMYYLWLACAAGVPFVGTPQGSDILLKPGKSILYRLATVRALRKARAITVDSAKMSDIVREISGVEAVIVQNGINMAAIHTVVNEAIGPPKSRRFITSMRAVTYLYRIEAIISARNTSFQNGRSPVHLVYPFYEFNCLRRLRSLLQEIDQDLGRLSREEMYGIFLNSKLVISIPESDSSPRSVYEAIFCGAAVAVAYHPYVDAMPACMRDRIVLVDIDSEGWFDYAVQAAERIVETPFNPSLEARNMYDQVRSFQLLDSLLS